MVHMEKRQMMSTRSSPLPPPSLPSSSGAPQEHAVQPICSASSRVDATAVSAYAQCRRSRGTGSTACRLWDARAVLCWRAANTLTQPSGQHATPTCLLSLPIRPAPRHRPRLLPKHALVHLCRDVLETAENSPPLLNVNLCLVLFGV